MRWESVSLFLLVDPSSLEYSISFLLLNNTGMVKLKKHKETGARRILLRITSTGKVAIVRLFSHCALLGFLNNLFLEFQNLSGTERQSKNKGSLFCRA
jgi:hypothetical protein